jgi:hypothetical protein
LGPNKRRTLGTENLPTQGGVLVGSYASVARMLDELSAVPGVLGAMLTFDDFVIGMEQFGTRILPLMRCREGTMVRVALATDAGDEAAALVPDATFYVRTRRPRRCRDFGLEPARCTCR